MNVGWLIPMSLVVASAAAQSQVSDRALGSVPMDQATVAGPANGPLLIDGRAQLVGSVKVTARPNRNAVVNLVRGGGLLVCRTTGVHITQSIDDSLLLGLDRGAMEVHMKARATDVVITPDLRFTMEKSGPLDLRMRVVFNGDTCVENRGRKSPPLHITDAFGDTAYIVKPGQHVLFEHGSLQSVMDRESTPCGCPPDEKSAMSLAQAMKHGGPISPEQAAAIHPFPTAQSDGLAQPAPGTPEAPGERHVQVAASIAFDPKDAEAAKRSDSGAAASQAKRKRGPFAAIGRFFKRLFAH